MALGDSYARDLVRRGPSAPPMEDDVDMDAEDEGASDDKDPVAMSAFEDFAKAAGIKSTPQAYSALKELIHACMKG